MAGFKHFTLGVWHNRDRAGCRRRIRSGPGFRRAGVAGARKNGHERQDGLGHQHRGADGQRHRLASSDGSIINQTRTVKPVTPAPPHTGWYLNLHLGNGGDILAKGMPALNFRPELCGDVTSVAASHG